MPETAQEYELSSLRACRKVDIGWDGLQFLCISLCRRLLKSMSCPFSGHAKKLILAETVFNFYALAYAGDCSKVWVILLTACRKVHISWDGCQFLCMRLLRSMSYSFSEHAERFTLAETTFNFYGLAYVRVCSKVWFTFFLSMQKGWY